MKESTKSQEGAYIAITQQYFLYRLLASPLSSRFSATPHSPHYGNLLPHLSFPPIPFPTILQLTSSQISSWSPPRDFVTPTPYL